MSKTLDIVPTAQAGARYDFSGAAVVVIDVLRATTSMLHIFESGGTAIYPVGEVDAAREKKSEMEKALLCGERYGVPPEGFDMGNSPKEFKEADLSRREIILTTSNGTRAVEAAQGASVIAAASFENAGSAARYLMSCAAELPLYLLCSGTGGAFSIEDYFCAGTIASHLAAAGEFTPTDFAWAAVKLAGLPVGDVVNANTCRHLGFLIDKGFSADVELSLTREVEGQTRPVAVYDSSKGCFTPQSV